MNRNLAIIFPNKSSSSETFIKAHVDHLPCEKKILYGDWFPQFAEGDKPLVSKPIGFIGKIVLKLNNRILKRNRRQNAKQFLRHRALVRYFKNNNIGAVLAEYGLTGAAVMDVCEELKIPLIVHFHGFDAYHEETLSKYKSRYISMFRNAAAIIAVSREMEKQLISLGAPPEKVFYNPYGVDVEKFIPRVKPVFEPLFFFIGRFVNKKAPHLLILAFLKVREVIPGAKLVMAGDGGLGNSGDLFYACKQLVKATGLTKDVEFKGAIRAEDVPAEMQKAYAYVQHSVRAENGDSEGTPNSILEAGACGLPVVATRHAGINDVISDGATGYLVDEYDVQGMADKMIALVNDPTRAFNMGQANRKNIVENFNMEKSIQKLWSIINDTATVNKY